MTPAHLPGITLCPRVAEQAFSRLERTPLAGLELIRAVKAPLGYTRAFARRYHARAELNQACPIAIPRFAGLTDFPGLGDIVRRKLVINVGAGPSRCHSHEGDPDE